MASAQPIQQPSHRGAPPMNNVQQAVSPPSKEQLKSWWTKFGRKKEKPESQVPLATGIFGVPLSESILYANVAISLTNEQGESFIYGYVPIVVAKCGVFLKERATDVEGIFRLSGSAKRIKDLQNVFNSPERYGKGLDWTGYTVHDAANILRRYLNQLPEPIVPLQYYENFRDPLRDYQAKVGDSSQPQAMENQEHSRAVVAYQRLITELPALNRQLLLYILDLLAVFASKSDLNRMTAQNLAAIFQPGIISHPNHHMAPNEYRLSQDVLIFLIENQDNFLIGMSGTAMDQKTKDEVKSGPPSIKTPKTAIGRSASTASAGADSIRRTAAVRRNGSMSSRNSRDRSSPGVSSPATPASPSGMATTPVSAGGGLGRSNTVPSNRSPNITGPRFQRASEVTAAATPVGIAPISNSTTTGGSAGPAPEDEKTPFPSVEGGGPGDNVPPPQETSVLNTMRAQALSVNATDVRIPPEQSHSTASPTSTDGLTTAAAQELRPGSDVSSAAATGSKASNRDRKISNLLSISPMFGPSDQIRDPGRQPRKLQKRRIPGSHNESAQSSQASLNADVENFLHGSASTANATQDRSQHNENYSPSTANPPTTEPAAIAPSPTKQEGSTAGRNLMPPHSPTTSIKSRGSATEPSDFDGLDDPAVREEKKRHKFRLSSARNDAPLVPPPAIGQLPGARTSNSSLGSNRPRKSFTGDSQLTQTSIQDASSTGQPSFTNISSRESAEQQQGETEKKGLFGRFKARINQTREHYEAEKERNKSPPRVQGEHANSRGSLSAFTHDHFAARGRSFDRSREESLSHAPERGQGQPAQTQPPVQTQIQPPTPVPGPAATFGPQHVPSAAPAPVEQPITANAFPVQEPQPNAVPNNVLHDESQQEARQPPTAPVVHVPTETPTAPSNEERIDTKPSQPAVLETNNSTEVGQDPRVTTLHRDVETGEISPKSTTHFAAQPASQ